MHAEQAAALVAAVPLDDTHPVAVVLDLRALDAAAGAFRAALPGVHLHFALKALPLPAVARRLGAAGFGLEAASGPELELALALAPAAAVVYDAPVKTDAELRRAVDAGVLVHADHLDELERIAALRPGPGARVGLRVNPGLPPGRIAATTTASPGSKFGEDLRAHRDAVIGAFRRHPWLRGLHVHVGSQGEDPSRIVAAARVLGALAAEVEAAGGRVDSLDLGGGLPVDYGSDPGADPHADLFAFGDALRAGVPELFHGERAVRMEPGRRLVAKAAVVVSRVEAHKWSGGRRILLTHAGADLFVRTAYQPETWPHRLSLHGPDGAPVRGAPVETDVAGPLCFSGDRLAVGVPLPPAVRGDRLVVHDAGAYTLAMWSRYNSRRSPPVFGWDGSALTVLRPGEDTAAVLAFWGLDAAATREGQIT